MGKASTQTPRAKVEAIASAILEEKFRAEKPQLVETLVSRFVEGRSLKGSLARIVSEGHFVKAPDKGKSKASRRSEHAQNERPLVLTSAALTVVEEARRVFGEHKIAESWLNHPRHQFGGKTPYQMLGTSPGRKAVSELLGQIDHGIYG